MNYYIRIKYMYYTVANIMFNFLESFFCYIKGKNSSILMNVKKKWYFQNEVAWGDHFVS